MNILNPVAARAAVYDRNPVQKQVSYAAAGVAPHSATSRATYTVTTGKKAIVTRCRVSLIRATASTTAGKASIYVTYAPSGGTSGNIALAQHLVTTQGAADRDTIDGVHVMGAGDTLTIYTADGSTGGTVDYDAYITVLEFDP
jgi:hypothetical protein